ncbi:MAG: AMP-binding protein, partial [Deltaproteobacteria bacterium]|nr:AMP-binding protein [Deltaproteobacteria bacterium]
MRVIGDLSKFNARRFPNKPALILGEEKLTYLELDRLSNAVANWLVSQGVSAGDRVAILALSSPEFAVITQAIAKAGAVFVPVNARFSPAEIAVLLSGSDARVLFLEPEFLADVEEAFASSTARPQRVVIRSKDAPEGIHRLERILAEQPQTPPDVKVDPSSPTMIMYTGGTTGAPKGVVYSHYMFLRCIEGAVVEGDLGPTDVMHLTMPLFHNGGYAAMLGPALMVGATVVCYRGSFEPERILADIERYRITLT